MNALDQLWQLESLLGVEQLTKTAQKHRCIGSQTIEDLFQQASFTFYADTNEAYLFSHNNELYEADFGPLHEINSLDALKKFGLQVLENTKEKGFVRL